MQRGHPSASLTLGTSPVGEAFGSVFCLPFRGGGKNRQLKLSIFAGGVSTAQVDIFDNIMTFNQDNLDGDAFNYFGTRITYGELPALRDAYARGLKLAGVKEGDVVTICLPVCIENAMLLFAVNFLNAISNNVNFLYLKHDFLTYTKEKNSHIIITLDAFLPYFVDHLEIG